MLYCKKLQLCSVPGLLLLEVVVVVVVVVVVFDENAVVLPRSR